MKSGKRDNLVTIERDGGTNENSFGERISGWSTYTTAWCSVTYSSGQERRSAGVEGADQKATFRTLANATTLAVTTKDRISFDGNWDIVDVSPLARDGVEYTAIRRSA